MSMTKITESAINKFAIELLKKQELVTNCDRLDRLKLSSALPLVFTEQGVAMLSSVLRSKRAVQVNIEIMRTFVRLRQLLASHTEKERFLRQDMHYKRNFFGTFSFIRSRNT